MSPLQGIALDQRIRLVPRQNPKRPGSKAHRRWRGLRDGMTVAEYLRRPTQRPWARHELRWNLRAGLLRLEPEQVPTPAMAPPVYGGPPAAEVLDQFDRLVHQMASRCQRKLPPWSPQAHEDLAQEGRLAVWEAAPKFNPARGVKMITFLTTVLAHRYGKLVRQEWHRSGPSFPVTDEGVLARLRTDPAQHCVEILDRYTPAQIYAAMEGEASRPLTPRRSR